MITFVIVNENPIHISGVIITSNEEKNIGRCLNSLSDVCDEIIVVDSLSTDRTKEICEEHTVKFIENPFPGHIEQKNFALDQASYDYVLSLDADEALSPELKASILKAKENWQHHAYKFNRFTNYCGQWIRHSGWYPDTKIRLWDRRKGRWGGLNPHDSVILNSDADAKHLEGDLLHYSYYTINEHIDRSMKYAKISAYALQQKKKKATILKLVLNPIFRFIKDYLIRGGFRDGFYGLIICATNSYTTFLKYAYLKALNRKKVIE